MQLGSWLTGLTCLGASVLVPAPHSLRTAPCGHLVPMCQSSGSCVCRAVQKLAIGLNTIQWTTEACLAAAGHTYHGFECELALRVYPVKNPSNFGPRFSHRSDRFDRSAFGRPERNVMDRPMAMRKKIDNFLPESLPAPLKLQSSRAR